MRGANPPPPPPPPPLLPPPPPPPPPPSPYCNGNGFITVQLTDQVNPTSSPTLLVTVASCSCDGTTPRSLTAPHLHFMLWNNTQRSTALYLHLLLHAPPACCRWLLNTVQRKGRVQRGPSCSSASLHQASADATQRSPPPHTPFDPKQCRGVCSGVLDFVCCSPSPAPIPENTRNRTTHAVDNVQMRAARRGNWLSPPNLESGPKVAYMFVRLPNPNPNPNH
jgi:hypothetical protein